MFSGAPAGIMIGERERLPNISVPEWNDDRCFDKVMYFESSTRRFWNFHHQVSTSPIGSIPLRKAPKDPKISKNKAQLGQFSLKYDIQSQNQSSFIKNWDNQSRNTIQRPKSQCQLSQQMFEKNQYHRFAADFHNVSPQRCRFRYLLHTAFLVE